MTTIEKFARDMARKKREYLKQYKIKLSYRKSLDWAANVLFFANWKHLLEHKNEEYIPEQLQPINFVSNGKVVATVSSNSTWTFGPSGHAAGEFRSQHTFTSLVHALNTKNPQEENTTEI